MCHPLGLTVCGDAVRMIFSFHRAHELAAPMFSTSKACANRSHQSVQVSKNQKQAGKLEVVKSASRLFYKVVSCLSAEPKKYKSHRPTEEHATTFGCPLGKDETEVANWPIHGDPEKKCGNE